MSNDRLTKFHTAEKDMENNTELVLSDYPQNLLRFMTPIFLVACNFSTSSLVSLRSAVTVINAT